MDQTHFDVLTRITDIEDTVLRPQTASLRPEIHFQFRPKPADAKWVQDQAKDLGFDALLSLFS